MNNFLWVLKGQSSIYQPPSRSSLLGVKRGSETAWRHPTAMVPPPCTCPFPILWFLAVVILSDLKEMAHQCNLKTNLLSFPSPFQLDCHPSSTKNFWLWHHINTKYYWVFYYYCYYKYYFNCSQVRLRNLRTSCYSPLPPAELKISSSSCQAFKWYGDIFIKIFFILTMIWVNMIILLNWRGEKWRQRCHVLP